MLEQCFRSVIDASRAVRRSAAAIDLFIGGKSMGGRMATHLGAQGVDGLRDHRLRLPAASSRSAPEAARESSAGHRGPGAHRPGGTGCVRHALGAGGAAGHDDRAGDAPSDSGADHSLNVRGKAREESFASMLDTVAEWMRRVWSHSMSSHLLLVPRCARRRWRRSRCRPGEPWAAPAPSAVAARSSGESLGPDVTIGEATARPHGWATACRWRRSAWGSPR